MRGAYQGEGSFDDPIEVWRMMALFQEDWTTQSIVGLVAFLGNNWHDLVRDSKGWMF